MAIPDSLQAWQTHYLQMAVVGVRSSAVQRKIELHLKRFTDYFQKCYAHDRLSTVMKRDVLAWRDTLVQSGLAPTTINNHIASLSGFMTWIAAHAPEMFPVGTPMSGISELPLPPLEPRALTDQQIQSLKNLCDRLFPYYNIKGRRHTRSGNPTTLRATARPWRDRAIIFVLLSTGLRRSELVQLNLQQLQPYSPDELRRVYQARLKGVQGKGKSQRDVFLSADARHALADYLQHEHELDCSSTDEEPIPLFLTASQVASRQTDGRLSARAVNLILEQIGRWHDGELADLERHISPLRPHDLRHTFAFQLARKTNADAYELERRLGHRSSRYIQRYTNPPENVAATYVEDF